MIDLLNNLFRDKSKKLSNYEDCRVNAYPSFTKYNGINRTAPSFLIEIDLKDFVSNEKLDRALNRILKRIEDKICGHPSVLWTTGVLRYSSEIHKITKLEDHEGKEITVEELVDQSYNDPDKYFEINGNNDAPTGGTGTAISIASLKPEIKNNKYRGSATNVS